MLARDQRGQVVMVLVEQLLELEQDARTPQRRRLGPCRKCGLGGGDGGGNVLRGSQRHARSNFARRRVIDIGQALRRATRLPAAEEMSNGSLHSAGFCKDVFHFHSCWILDIEDRPHHCAR
ncbi:hypothetical protein D9M69_583240 [compost metagenome]